MGGKHSKSRQQKKGNYQEEDQFKQISIQKDPITGQLIGVPKEWANVLNMNVDQSKTVDTSHLPQHVQPSELPQEILDLISEPIISEPFNIEHKIHITIDSNEPLGLRGLPPEWIDKMKKNDLRKEDIQANPEAMISIISQYEEGGYQLRRVSLPTNDEFLKQIQSIEFQNSDPSLKYKFTEMLGKGAVCKVYKAFNRTTKEEVAVRVMKLGSDHDRLKIEIALMKMCESNNIVKYYESFIYSNCLFMVIEYLDGGCLTELIYQNYKQFKEIEIAYICGEILQGLAYMHQKKKVHRDLKSDNILMNKQGEIKIADFGFATQLTAERQHRKSVVGTPAWMSPELIQKQDYNEKTDIWSVGIIAIELANGEPPHLRVPPLKAMFLITSSDPPKLNQKMNFSQDFHEFIDKVLAKDPKMRLSAEEALRLNFFKNRNKENVRILIQNKKNIPLSELIKLVGKQ